MAYIDKDYYDNSYKGESVDEVDFPSLAERASRDIDELTGFNIKSLDSITEVQQMYIKLATASQLEYLDQNGIMSDTFQTATLGKFSYSGSGRASRFSARASAYVFASGLAYRGL